jgi:SNF2 family DNA or RNA helicase
MEYVEAQNIRGTKLYNNSYVIMQEYIDFDDYVYDLEIPETHNYIVEGGIVVHNCKDSTSLQGKALLSLNAESIVALTGTPLMNNAIDLYTPLKFIGQEHHSLFQFKGHYCILGGFGNHQIVGYKNLPELQATLDKCMLRRLKKDVLDLPDKIYVNDYVEMSPSQIKVYTSILEDLRQNIDKVKLSPNPLTMLIRLRQCTGNPELLSTTVKGSPKYERMLDIVEEVVKEDKKAIVFSNWTDVLNPAYEALQANGYKPALYTGQNKDERESEKQRFKTDSSCKVICGTIGAMGTGLTLTEATTVIFLDEPWNRAIKDQAEDRAHRIGTTESLNVITIMCKNTIDEKINKLVYRKGKMSDIIVDKEEDLFKNPQVLNFLLSV